MATLRKKPRVGIIHSTKSKITTAGKDLAVYLGVCLQLGGYSDVRIIGFSSEAAESKPADVSPHGKFLVVPYESKDPISPNHCECFRDEWKSLGDCNMVLMCVDPPDTASCAQALASVMKPEADIAIISFDLGVRNHAAVQEHLANHGIGVLAGAVGICVVRDPVNGYLRCLGSGTLVVERLSKKQSKEGMKFINLLRSAGIPVRHCKNVTSYSHGAIAFNTVYAAAALAGLPLREFLRDRSARLLWAAMVREALQVLVLSARGGSWRPANPCCSLTLSQLELLLCLPTPLFGLLSRLVLRFAPTLAPPMQMDLTRGRETAVAWTLGEVVRIGDTYNTPVPACHAVYSAVTLAVRVGNGVPSKKPQSLIAQAYGPEASMSARALRRKVVAWCFAITLVAAALGVVGGLWLAAVGILAILFATFIFYVVVGDVVP